MATNDPTEPIVAAARNVDLHNQQEVDEFFAYLKREHPQIVEAIEVMGIPMQNYLMALQSIRQQTSISTGSTQIFL